DLRPPLPVAPFHVSHRSLFFLETPPPPSSSLFPSTTLFRSPMTNPSRRLSHGRDAAVGVSLKSVDSALQAFKPISTTHRRRHRRSEEHTSELQSLTNLVCRLLLEKKKKEQQRRQPPAPHNRY